MSVDYIYHIYTYTHIYRQTDRFLLLLLSIRVALVIWR